MIGTQKETGDIRFAHLEHSSFAELFALKRESERRLNALRRKEPSARKRCTPEYTAWIGQNVECIDHLNRIRREIARRKERAAAVGISVFAYDGKRLLVI